MKKNYRILDGYAYITAAVLLAIIIVSALCGCGSKKVITEQVYVRDTLVVSHTDTLQVERWSWRHDTVRIEAEKIVTLLQADKTLPAETIRIETNNWHFEREVVGDSTNKVIARVDSVLRVLDAMHNKKEVKKERHYGWQGFAIFLLAVGGCCIYCLVSTRIKP